jgi:RNA polymerase sigma-70 factor (ECF subfamily)
MNSSDLLSMVNVPTPDTRTPRAHRRRPTSSKVERTPAPDDLRLVRRLLQREPAAWREFLDRYERLLYGRVLSTFHELGREPRPEQVEDCCAEVLAALFRDDIKALRGFEGRARLSTWLTVVTRRVTLNLVLRRGAEAEQQPDSHSDLNLVPAPGQSSSLSDELDCREIVLQLCLRKLSPADQLVLDLHFTHKLTYEQIGARLGITANAVGPKLSRAQQRLKTLVAQHRPQDAAEPQPGGGSE